MKPGEPLLSSLGPPLVAPLQPSRGFFRLDERREKGADVEMARGDKVRAIAPSPEESPCLFFGFAPNLGMEPGSF